MHSSVIGLEKLHNYRMLNVEMNAAEQHFI